MLRSIKERRRLFLVFVSSLLLSMVCAAAPGDPDPSFGTGGVATESIGAEVTIYSVSIQPDGKIVVVGTRKLGDQPLSTPKERLFIRRYMSNGLPDHVQSFPSLILGKGMTAAIQSDGKIIVLGKAPNSFTTPQGTAVGDSPVVWRFNADGSLDTTLGVQGARFINSVAAGDYHIDQFRGRIYIAYASRPANLPGNPIPFPTTYKVARLSSTGSIDLTIEPSLVYGGPNDKKFSMKVDRGNGNVYVLGIKPTSLDVVVDGYTSNLSALTTFGQNGEASVADCVQPEPDPKDLVIQPDGKLLVLRFTYGLNQYVCTSRLLTTGITDPGFAGYFGYLPDQVGAKLNLQPDGKMFFYVGAFGRSDRFNSDGTFDRYLPGVNYDPSTMQPDQKYVTARAVSPDYTSVRIERRLLD